MCSLCDPAARLRLFKAVFGKQWLAANGVCEAVYKEWFCVRNELVHGLECQHSGRLEKGCVYMCALIQVINAWNFAQAHLSKEE